MSEEVGRDHGADRVAAQVLWRRVAAAVTKEPSHRVRATFLKWATHNIARGLLEKTHDLIMS